MTTPDSSAALAFLRSHAAGVVATVAPEGGPRARTVYYVADDTFGIHFFTLTSTRKVAELKPNDRVAFVVSSETPAKTLQIEGTIENITDAARMDDPFVRMLSTQMMERGLLENPLTHLDPGHIAYYRIAPTFVRFGDFSKGFGAQAVFSDITPSA